MYEPLPVCSVPDPKIAEDANSVKPVLKIATTYRELEEYYRIRHKVFVVEQKIFKNTDKDKHDENAIPIIACYKYKAVGAVRCYPKTKKVWLGGRLAVDKDFRKYNIGALLVHKAVETMNNRSDVHRFLATIQLQNVRFFRRIGWIKLGRIFIMKGKKHQMMEKVLEGRRR
tara:strand:+ start:13798 stop:14310 length:513 start_codon:yes stop_codon:yes gene_type:complete